MIFNADTADDSLNTQSQEIALSARRPRCLRSLPIASSSAGGRNDSQRRHRKPFAEYAKPGDRVVREASALSAFVSTR